MATVASSVARPRKCHIHRLERKLLAGNSLFSSEIILISFSASRDSRYVRLFFSVLLAWNSLFISVLLFAWYIVYLTCINLDFMRLNRKTDKPIKTEVVLWNQLECVLFIRAKALEKPFHPIRNQLSEWTSQFAKRVHVAFWRLFNLPSQKFL